MADYQLTANPDTILRTADGAWIPNDERNADYQQYLVWLAEGNTPDPYVPPGPAPPPPEDVVLYDHENRLRSLEGQPPLTIADFLAKTKGAA